MNCTYLLFFLFKAMTILSGAHTLLRQVVEHVLATGEAPNKLFPLNIISKMCCDAAGIKSDEQRSLIEKEMSNAYKGAQDGEELVIDDDTDNVIRVYRYREFQQKEVFAIGRFDEAAPAAQARADRTVSQYPSRGVTMNDETKAKLQTYINGRIKRKAATAPPQAAAEREGVSQQAKKKQKVVVEEVKEGDEEVDEEAKRQAEVTTLNAKMDKLLKMDAKQQLAWLAAEKKRLETRTEIANVQNRLTELGATSTRPEAMAVPEGGRTLYYILDGRGGTINYPEGSACVLDSDIQGNLATLPPSSGDGWNDEEIRKTRKYKLVKFGQTQYFVPVGASGAANNWQVRKEDSHETLDTLRSLFDGKQSKFGEEALGYLAAGNVQGYGASWEFTETILVTWTKAILEQLGIDDDEIDAASIAKGCPGRKTIANHEANLAADCMVVIMQEIMDDGAKHFCLITDHGKRSGLEHFVKLLVWCGWKDEKKEEKMLKFHCLDVDTSAHDAEGCAKAVKKSLEEFSGLEGFTITAITGDAGGGGAVQNLLPALVRINAVDSGAVKINCLMHALNKCLELAGQETFGEQGINQRTPFQLLFVFNQLWKAIKEEGGGGSGGKAYLDEIYSIVTHQILNDGDWQQEANVNFKQAFNEFKEALATLEDLDDDEGIDDLVEFMTRTPSNIQDPVFSRWRTVMSCTRVVLKYWTQIYFMAVAIKQTETSLNKPTSYLCTLSSALLSLMKEKNTADEGAYYDPANTVMADVDDLTADDSDSDIQPPLKPNDTPVFYAMLLFFQAFGDAYFDDMFHFAMKDDPILDKGSYGQISRYCVERLYVMHKALSELEGDGWKDRAEFKAYNNALEGFNAKNQAYFDKMSRVFLMRYRFVFEKHIEPCWRSNGVLPYIIGGNPTLANQFARWLFDDDNEAVAIEDDDVVEEYGFLDKDIDLGPFHHRTIANKKVVINVKDCMLYLTAEADREAIKSTPFVKSHKELIKKMGQCNHEVNLLNKRTWGAGNDFSELEDAIWNEIAIHSCHQQRVEQFVQLAALVAKTNVKEARRTMRAIILSTIIRPFHLWAKQIIAERQGDDKLRRRVEGAVRGELFLKYMMAFRKRLERAKRLLEVREPGKYNAIKERLTNQHNKASATLRSKKVEKMMSSIENGRRKITKGEQAEGYIDEPLIMSGNIMFKLLTMTRSCQTCNDAWKKKKHTKCEREGCCMAAVHAELDERNIKLSKKQCNELTITQKRHKIRDHEAKKVMVDQGKGEQGFNISQVKHLKPQSELMKSLKPMQIEMLNVEKGLNLSWNSENA